jgi:hypothetical protein
MGAIALLSPVAVFMLTACSDNTTIITDRTGDLIINTSARYEPSPGTSLDMFIGTLQADGGRCVYLQTEDGEQDLVWPDSFQASKLAVYQTQRGTQLAVGKKVYLVGVEKAPEARLSCRHTDGDTVIYINDFVGKTTGGG